MLAISDYLKFIPGVIQIIGSIVTIILCFDIIRATNRIQKRLNQQRDELDRITGNHPNDNQ